MQPNPDSFSISRRPMDLEDYIDIFRRHRGWIFGPAFAGLVIAVVVAFIWPDTYVSDAAIRIVPPAVPERYVPSNVNLQIGQRIASMEQQVRSRTNVLNLINSNGLYPRKKGRIPDEDLVEAMNKDIVILPISSLREVTGSQFYSTAFRVSFRYENRYLAQKVVSQIVGIFLDETVRTRSGESVMTTEFLKEKVAGAKKELDDIENRLTQYKQRFAGKLPDQLDSNLAQMRAIETQLTAANSSVNRVNEEKLLLENEMRAAKEQLQAAPSNASQTTLEAAKSARLLELERQIVSQETLLAALRQQYSDAHPDVKHAVSQLAGIRSNRDALVKEEEKKSGAAAAAPKADFVAQTREQKQIQLNMERLQAQIEARNMEIEQLVRDQARLSKMLKAYQERIDASPEGQREYAQLTRNYSLAKQQYEELMLKSSQSSMATDLETRKQGEALEVLEQASLPQAPSEPNRWLLVAIGAAIGLGVGILLAGAREMKDTSLKNLKDVRAYTGLPVLGSVPLVQNDLLVQRKRRLAWVAWSSACIVGFLMMLGSVYYYYTKGA